MKDQYAIVQAAGHQFKLTVGQALTTDRQHIDVGQDVAFDQVLFVREGDKVEVGRPMVKGAQVICQVQQHRRGKKITVFKFKRRQNYRRTQGHRSELTDLIVKEIRT
jgi:large subunit ribosomal protein L21